MINMLVTCYCCYFWERKPGVYHTAGYLWHELATKHCVFP